MQETTDFTQESNTTLAPWLQQLKRAYDAGYYKTEAAPQRQVGFPWQDKTCQDCPFWSNGICQVFAEYRGASTHTCAYFDPWHRDSAQHIVQARQNAGFQRWWEWFNQ